MIYSDLTNLLPQERQDALARDYFLRLGVVAALFLTALMIVAAALLIPSYVLLAKNASADEARLASVKAKLSSSNEAELSARLTALANDAATLAALAKARSVSAVMRALLAVPHSGTAITGMVYTPALGDVRGTILVSGTAATRDALRRYQLALQGAPGIQSADVPVSAYAQDADIPFTITVILSR